MAKKNKKKKKNIARECVYTVISSIQFAAKYIKTRSGDLKKKLKGKKKKVKV